MGKVLGLLLLALLGCRATPPNIVIFMSDDVGYNDHAFHGSNQIRTPNIDAMAFRGVIMDKFYTQQTCTPSRAALLTGNYPIRSGMQGIPIKTGEERHLPLDMPTLPEKLKELGYQTHLVGKWHLGYGHKNYTPTGRGFDTHFGYLNGFVGYFDYEIKSEYDGILSSLTNQHYFDLYDGFEPQHQVKGQYSTYAFTDRAVKIIEEHDTTKPLFLEVSYLAGHAGRDGTELGVPNVTETKMRYHYITNSRRQLFADVMTHMDGSIGQIMSKFDERNMLQNTIVIYLPDNGGQTVGMYANEASNFPYRGLKFTLFEGGVRGTGVIYSPLLEKTGYINNQLIHITDLLPTLYHAAGGDVSTLGNIDGINQWEVLSKNIPTNRTEILLNIDEKEGNSGILGYNGRYKLLRGSFKFAVFDQHYGDSGRGPEVPPYTYNETLDSPANRALQRITNVQLTQEKIDSTRAALDKVDRCNGNRPLFLPRSYYLFDMDQDPCENSNLINQPDMANVVDALKAKLEEFDKVLVPQQNKSPDRKSDPKQCNNTWFFWQDADGCYLGDQTSKGEGTVIDQITNVLFR